MISKNFGMFNKTIKIFLNKSTYRRFYSPPINFYRIKRAHYKNMKRAKSLAKELIHLISSTKIKPVSIIFSDEDTPPLVGDFFCVVLFIRYLSTHNIKTNFYVCRKRGININKVWDNTTEEELNEYYRQQKIISESLLISDTKIIFTEGSKSDIQGLLANRPEFLIDLPGLEALSPYLIFLLMKHFHDVLPDSFLLSNENYPNFAPYITWGIRLSKWQKYRNSSKQSISRDFSALLKCFPDKNIIILSNKLGLEFAFETLFGTNNPVEVKYNGVRVLPQPQDGFFEGAGYLLGSDFYFQRSGGGMIAPAVFSKIPYLCLQQHQNTFYGRKWFKAFSWSTKNQAIIVTTKYLTKLLRIRILVRLFNN